MIKRKIYFVASEHIIHLLVSLQVLEQTFPGLAFSEPDWKCLVVYYCVYCLKSLISFHIVSTNIHCTLFLMLNSSCSIDSS